MGRHSAPLVLHASAPAGPPPRPPCGSLRSGVSVVAAHRAPAPRVLGVLAAVVGVAVVLPVLAVTVVPALVGGQVHVVRSASMGPQLDVGSAAVVRPAPVGSIRPGDVIAFTERAPSGDVRTVVHRVIEVAPGPVFRTRGDANPAPDPNRVEATSVSGRLWFDVPWAGRVADAVRTGPGALVAGTVVLSATAAGVAARRRAARRLIVYSPSPL